MKRTGSNECMCVSQAACQRQGVKNCKRNAMAEVLTLGGHKQSAVPRQLSSVSFMA